MIHGPPVVRCPARPTGHGQGPMAIALAIKPAEATHPVAFDAATPWITRLRRRPDCLRSRVSRKDKKNLGRRGTM